MNPAEQIKLGASRAGGPDISDLAERFFREVLAQQSGIELREPQIQMARQVGEAICGPSVGRYVAEAPCGSGKSLAYLVPAVMAVLRHRFGGGNPKGRVIISTSNIGLQSQIVNKDIPFLARTLGIDIAAAVAKSRSNWICPDALYNARLKRDHPKIALFDRAHRWLQNGGSGDREDIPMRLGAEWREMSVGADGCVGPKCPFVKDCPSMKAAAKRKEASIVVVNHAYLARSLTHLVEDAVALIVDEAHDIEDALRNHSGAQVKETLADHWRKRLDKLGLTRDAQRVAEAIRIMTQTAGAMLGSRDELRIQPGWLPDAQVDEVRDRMEDALEALRNEHRGAPDELSKARLSVIGRQLGSLVRRMETLAQPPKRACTWVEKNHRGDIELRCAPVSVALAKGKTQLPIILCSATIGNPQRLAREIGVEPTAVDVLPSPWPIDQMGACIVPAGCPPATKSDPAWAAFAERAVEEFCQRCGGGVLVLATSRVAMRRLAVAAARSGLDVKTQEDAGRSELIDWFRGTKDSVLVGSRSLMQGVDISGDSLRGVVLDKIPFPAPGLLEEAINEFLAAQKLDPFRARALPKATTVLRQALGRLLRASTDRGIAMVLDGRIHSARYRKVLHRAIHPLPISTDMADVERVLGGAPIANPVYAPAKRGRALFVGV